MAVSAVDVKSSMASAMGAKISITGPARGMYLIIGRVALPDALVQSVEGQLVLRFNGRKMLAALPFAGYLALLSNRNISHIGPVTVDIKRLTKVAEMLSRSISPPNGG